MAVRVGPIHLVNTYLYQKGKTLGIFNDESLYGGRTAFTTLNEIARFQQMKNAKGEPIPYVVYNWSSPRRGVDYYVREQTCVYLVYGRKIDEITNITNFIEDTMDQSDRSATNVQAWAERLSGDKWGGRAKNPFTDIELYSINLEGINGPTPITEAGGVMESQVTLTIKYGVINQALQIEDEP